MAEQEFVIVPPSDTDVSAMALRTDVQFLDPYGSESINRKFFGIIPPGIYRGFKYALPGGMKLRIGLPNEPGTVVAQCDSVCITVQQTKPIDLTVAAGFSGLVVLTGFYKFGVPTKQVSTISTQDAAKIELIAASALKPNQVILYTVNVPAGTTVLTSAMISLARRQDVSIAVESDIYQLLNAHINSPTAHTKAQVGLGNVQNWGATAAINDTSDTKYSTAGAVKKAYDLAAAALPKAGGVVGAIKVQAASTHLTLAGPKGENPWHFEVNAANGDFKLVETGAASRFSLTKGGAATFASNVTALQAYVTAAQSTATNALTRRDFVLKWSEDNARPDALKQAGVYIGGTVKTDFNLLDAGSHGLYSSGPDGDKSLNMPPQEAWGGSWVGLEAQRMFNSDMLQTTLPFADAKTISFRTRRTGAFGQWVSFYSTAFKPTKSDVGLSLVNNWGATAAINDTSDAKYATAGAVKKAYDLAATKLASNANAVSATKLATARQINGTNFDGTANITTANWGTARTLTIGSTGKSVNGAGNVAWSLAEIGAAPTGHGIGTDGLPKADANTVGPTSGIYAGGGDGTKNFYDQYSPLFQMFRSGGADGTGRMLQIQDGDGTIAVRRRSENTWTPWAKLYSTQFKPTADDVGAVPLNGAKAMTGRLTVPALRVDNAEIVMQHDNSWDNLPANGIKRTHAAVGTPVHTGMSFGWQGSTEYGANIAFRNGSMKIRTKDNGVWGQWFESYHTGCKPTSADVGLGNVQNWPATAAINDASDAKYATAGAVKKAYDLAATKLASNANAVSATKLATARQINGTNFDGTANITTANWGTARTLTIGNAGKSVNGAGNVAWSLAEIGAPRAKGEVNTGASSNITTAEFIQWLTDNGAFNERAWTARGSWSYSNNKTITDTGCGNIHLSGCTIEVISSGASAYTVRIITPTTTSAGGTTGAEYVYVNNGPTYSPGWRRIYTTAFAPTKAEVGLDNVQNWPATAAINDASDAKYATAGAVKKAYDLAATKLASNANAVSATKLATARQINGTNFDGTANITTANWGTARTLTIGNAGKSVNGAGNVAWSLDEIGAAPSGFGIGETARQKDPNTLHVGGLWRDSVSTLAGITLPYDGSPSSRAIGVTSNGGLRAAARTAGDAYVWKRIYSEVDKPTSADVGLGNVQNWGATAAINDASDAKYATAGAVKKAYDLAAAALPKAGGIVTGETTFSARINAQILKATGEIQTNSVHSYRHVYGNYGTFWRNDGSSLFLMITNSGDQYGTYNALRPLTVNLASGLCTINGNAATATKLATARQINGTNFDGTANITTANWGTARTLTIGSAGKSVNGAGNVAWTLDEIGAVSTSAKNIVTSIDLDTLDTTDFYNLYKGSSGTVVFTGAPPDFDYGTLQVIGRGSVNGSFVTQILTWRNDGRQMIRTRNDGAMDWMPWKKIYSESQKPTKGDVGLSSVNNWGATAAINDASDAKYATAGAVKKAYDLAATKLASNANAVSASKWATARTITLTGGATGTVSIDGTANVSMAVTVPPTAHTHTPAQVGLGNVQNWPATAAINDASDAKYATAGAVKKAYDLAATKLASNANAVSATKLATARQINGTNFDGTANITTANWGTARTLTIGNAGKSVNGAGNVAWSLAEIGAAASQHNHPGSLINPIDLGVSDLDTIQTPGHYSQHANANTSAARHYPENNAGGLTVTSGAGVQQRYHVYNSSRVWTRAKYNTETWTPWARDYNTLNKPSAADVGLGNVANKGWDYGPSGDTYAVRDTAGDIQVRLLRSNYQNQSDISGAIAFRTNNSTDNYTRYCSNPAAVRAWLGVAPTTHTHTAAQGNADVVSGAWNAIGAYIMAQIYPADNHGDYPPGTKIAGSALRPCSIDNDPDDIWSSSLPGTWQCQGFARGRKGSVNEGDWTGHKTLWIRVA